MFKIYLISSGDIDKQYKIGYTRRKLIWEYSDSENCHIAITKYVKYYLHKKFDSNKNQYFNIEVYSYDRYFLLSNKKSKSYIFEDGLRELSSSV